MGRFRFDGLHDVPFAGGQPADTGHCLTASPFPLGLGQQLPQLGICLHQAYPISRHGLPRSAGDRHQ